MGGSLQLQPGQLSDWENEGGALTQSSAEKHKTHGTRSLLPLTKNGNKEQTTFSLLDEAEDLERSPAAQSRKTPRTAQSAFIRKRMDARGDSAKVRSWRRRVLLKKGAQMHRAMVERADCGSLAMLDTAGVVVSWYEGCRGGRSEGDHVLDHHVSQFYVPADIASSLPVRDLCNAVADGSSEQYGWRKDSDGAVFWGSTTTHAILLRGGALQGFSHITRASDGPGDARQVAVARPREAQMRTTAAQSSR